MNDDDINVRLWAGVRDRDVAGAFLPYLDGKASFQTCAMQAIDWLLQHRRSSKPVAAAAPVSKTSDDPAVPLMRTALERIAVDASDLVLRARAVARQAYPHEHVRAVSIPGLKLVSEANTHDHWRNRHGRSKKVKESVRAALRASGEPPPLPLRVTITRVAPGELDDDNACRSAKVTRDLVAEYVGVDDGDPRYTWIVRQRAGRPREYGVEIRIEPRVMGE